MSDRLYYHDAYRAEFAATVTEVLRVGDSAAAVLNVTAFYPTSGGQPSDRGHLAGAVVTDVVEDDAGRILHVLDRPVEVGTPLRGVIDWARRFDHMQQHTGQHILSAAFDRLLRARTVGFHLGAVVSSLDLAIDVPPEAVLSVETEANRVVWENRVVSVRFASEAEAAAMPLRKEPDRGGTLRIIEVEGYDLSACGGTHVRRSGEVGLIAVVSAERLRGGTRLEFVCGARALRTMRTWRDAVAGCIRSVSVAPEELPVAVERVQAEGKELRRTIKDLQERLAAHEAAAIAARAQVVGGIRVVVEEVPGQDQNGLKAMALAICATPGTKVALVSSTPPFVVVVARSKDTAIDAATVLRGLLAAFGGRGGGRPDLAQGGGLTGDLSAILSAARTALSVG